ncbi:HIRAN domain-containing protein [Microcoleus sp. S28C3]|uniref:HIRAN domain-containing protein n=1 Tax=Microcoleus sp. S28C3 TaxID=3055414 RepID=UPI002FD055A5
MFSNRVMPRSRPDYPEFVQWLNIPQHEDDPIALLARSGGKRVTDNFEVFPCPEPDENGRYRIHFFAHALRHLSKSAIERINGLQVGELLYLAHEFQNRHDSSALLLCTEDRWIVGYCPRYLCGDFFQIISQHRELVRVEVDRLNQPPTPLQFRLLCKMTADWRDFRPFSNPMYQPVSSDVLAASAIG